MERRLKWNKKSFSR